MQRFPNETHYTITIASLPSSDRADAVIHPRAFAIPKAHGNASMLSRQFGELL